MSSALSRPRLTRSITAAVATLACGIFIATSAAPAGAAVTFDGSTGTGFVGKGDVQTAFGWNDAKLQARAAGVTFSTSAPATQTLTSTATQDGTQAGTIDVTRSVSCFIDGKRQDFTNFGSREGERSGTRTGSRTGTRAGTLSGTLASQITYDTRQNWSGKITGFRLTGFDPVTGPVFTAAGDESWGDPVFEGDYAFGQYAWGDTTWSGWVKGEGSDGQPTDCLRTDNNTENGPVVTNLVDTTVEGDPVDGDVTDGSVLFGPTSVVSTDAAGAWTLFATYGAAKVAIG